jgi:hypothetical protein
VGSGLNTRYQGQPIVEIQAYNESNTCLGTSSGGQGVLVACPNVYGQGGGTGTVFVWNSSDYVINRHWSDYNYSIGEHNQTSWMCSPGVQGDLVILYDDSGTSGICQWSYG